MFFYDFFFFIRMVPVSKYIKGTTLLRNTYLPITEMKDSRGLLKRIEEEKMTTLRRTFCHWKEKLRLLGWTMIHIGPLSNVKKKDIHQKIKTLEVKRDFILLYCRFLSRLLEGRSLQMTYRISSYSFLTSVRKLFKFLLHKGQINEETIWNF